MLMGDAVLLAVYLVLVCTRRKVQLRVLLKAMVALFPRISIAIPIKTATKIICIGFPSVKGVKKFSFNCMGNIQHWGYGDYGQNRKEDDWTLYADDDSSDTARMCICHTVFFPKNRRRESHLQEKP